MKVYYFDQLSPEWFDIRFGKATSSKFGTIMANEDKAFGNPALEYAERIAIEGITRKPVESYSNQYMEDGIEQEPIARKAYEDYTFTQVSQVGFYESECGRFGGSPDGIVNPGGIEIKCVKYNTHFNTIKDGKYDPKYKWQITGNIWLAELEWIDFVSYCHVFPVGKQIFVDRVYRDEKMIDRLKKRLEDFWPLVEEHKLLIS